MFCSSGPEWVKDDHLAGENPGQRNVGLLRYCCNLQGNNLVVRAIKVCGRRSATITLYGFSVIGSHPGTRQVPPGVIESHCSCCFNTAHLGIPCNSVLYRYFPKCDPSWSWWSCVALGNIDTKGFLFLIQGASTGFLSTHPFTKCTWEFLGNTGIS